MDNTIEVKKDFTKFYSEYPESYINEKSTTFYKQI